MKYFLSALILLGIIGIGSWQSPFSPPSGVMQDYLSRNPGTTANQLTGSYVISRPGAFRVVNQSAAVGPVALVRAGELPTPSFLCVYVYAFTQSAGTGTTASVSINYTDPVGAKTFTSATWLLTSTAIAGTLNQSPVCFQAASGTAVTISTAGTFGTSTYAAEAFVTFERG